MNYDFTWLCFVRFISGLLAVILVFLLWKRRKAPGALSLLIFELFAAIWAFGDGFEAAATELNVKLFWSGFAYIGISTSSVMFLLFCLSYTRNERFLKKKILISLFVIPFITIILAFTNSSHKLLWSDVSIIPGTNDSLYYYGKWFWVHIIYQYSVLTVGVIVLLVNAFRTFSLYKAQMWILILGVALPFTASVLYVFKLTPVKGVDFTPISFIFTGILLAIAFYWFGFFNIVPLAHRQTIDNLQDGLLVIDTKNRIAASNPAFSRISDLPLNKIKGKYINEVLPSLNLRFSDFNEQNEFAAEIRREEKDDLKYYEVKVQPVKDARKNKIGTLLTVHDITLNKLILNAVSESNNRRRVELIEKEKLIIDLDAYARSVAHDLKNPVSSIIGLTDLIKTSISAGDIEEAVSLLDMLCNQSGKITSIIDDLLLLSRIRKEDISLTPIETGNIINAALKHEHKLILEKKAVIEKPADWPAVLGHKLWLEQIWINLINNALKYGGKPPVVKIGFNKTKDTEIRFWISDNGKGLTPESLAKIFNDFERLGNREVEGHGLGLSLVKRIVIKMGGEIIAESVNISGEGCTFSFTLNPVPE